MNLPQLDTAVVLFIYKRPLHAKTILSQIIAANPRILYVIADGPKADVPSDMSNCSETISLISEELKRTKLKIEWVISKYNMGLEQRITTGLNFVFAKEKQAIILEDDCVPDQTFFNYCEELLLRYGKDKRIGHISGTRYTYKVDIDDSYFGSKYPIEWGWATWADRWAQYDPKMKDWPDTKVSSTFRAFFRTGRTYKYWKWILSRCYSGEQNSWAYKWLYLNLKEGKISITPSRNLVRNIGLGNNSTNTLLKNSFAMPPISRLSFPLRHPQKITINSEDDVDLEKHMFSKSTLWLEIMTKRIKPLYRTANQFLAKLLSKV